MEIPSGSPVLAVPFDLAPSPLYYESGKADAGNVPFE